MTVVAKATFSFAHEGPVPRAQPRPILWEEVHHKNHPGRSIRFTPDVAPRLQRADILFNGSAYAPPGSPVETAFVRLGLFDGTRTLLDKKLIVRQKGGFQSIPLVYERAYGGVGIADNPLGVGAAGGEQPSVIDPAEPTRPAGLAPIARAWPLRRKLLKGLSGSPGKGIVEIPDAFVWDAFQAAPPDQQVGLLSGNEWIVMDALHPSLPRVQMRLPGARGAARIFGLAAHGVPEGAPLQLVLDLLHIDGEDQLVTATFRGSFTVPSEEALAGVRIVAGVEAQGEPIAWDTAAAIAPAPRPGTARAPTEMTVELSEEDLEAESDLAATLVHEAAASGARSAAEEPPGAKLASTSEIAPSSVKTVLPFQRSDAPSPLARPSTPSAAPAPARRDFSATVVVDEDGPEAAWTRNPTPFGAARAPSVPAPPPPAPPLVPPAPPPVAAPVPPPVPAPNEKLPITKPAETPPQAAPRQAPADPAAASPWAPAPASPPAPRAPKPAPKPAGPPPVSPALKRGLYDRFGKP